MTHTHTHCTPARLWMLHVSPKISLHISCLWYVKAGCNLAIIKAELAEAQTSHPVMQSSAFKPGREGAIISKHILKEYV